MWKRYLEEVGKDPTLAYGPGRGAIGSPATVREFLRGYEESGVDEIILLLNPRSHEGTMESIELMGKEVLPEFIERDQKAVADKAERLAPVIEKVEARRPKSTAAFDENYSFGGLPTGRGGNFTASEIPEAMAEINEGRVQAAQRAKERAANAGRGDTLGQIDELWRYDGRRAVVTGCASGIGEHVVRQLTELGADVVGLDKRRPAARDQRLSRGRPGRPGVHRRRASRPSTTTSTCCSTSPESPRASATRHWSSRSTFWACGISPRR